MITLITGGTRSGKSSFAQKKALALSSAPVCIATADIVDEEFAQRVKRHQKDRGRQWTTYERNRNLHELPLEGKVVMVDCVTLWLSRIFADQKYDTDRSLENFKYQFEKLSAINCTLLIISNEIGMSVHAQSEAGRKFVDLQGWANQHIASVADEVICMISGLPLTLKK